MTFDYLENNLRRLSDLAYDQQMQDPAHPQPSELVANWSGTYLYNPNQSYIGYFWSIVYNMTPYFGYPEAKQIKLQSAIKYTQELFFDLRKKALGAQINYTEVLKDTQIKDSLIETHFQKSRLTLIKWQSATCQWAQFLKTPESTRVVKWIKNQCEKDKSLSKLFFCLQFSKKTTSLRRFYKIITYETLLEEILPLSLFFKLASAQEPNYIEKRELKRIIRKLNKNKCNVTIRTFDKALRRFIEVFENLNNNTNFTHKVSLEKLFTALHLKGCVMFSKEDEKLLEWGRSLKPGLEISCNGRKFILGEQLGRKSPLKNNGRIIFAIENNPSIVLSVGLNCSHHVLTKHIYEQQSCALRSAKYVDIDPKGRFAIIEKIGEYINHYTWKSLSPKILPKDRLRLDPIMKLLQWCIEQNKTPDNLHPKHITINQNGQLKCTKVFTEGTFKYNTIVQFIKDFAKGNQWVHNYLLRSILFYTEKMKSITTMYEHMVINGTQEVPIKPLDLLAAHRIDPHYTDVLKQVAVLFSQVVETKKSCFKKLTEKSPLTDSILITEKIRNAILLCYKKNNYIYSLPDHFEQEVMQAIANVD